MQLDLVTIVLIAAAALGLCLAAAGMLRRSLPLLVAAGAVAITAFGFALSAIVLA